LGKRSGQGFNSYSIVKVLLVFQLYHPTKGRKVIFQNEPIFTMFSDGDVFTGLKLFTSQQVGFGQADNGRFVVGD